MLKKNWVRLVLILVLSVFVLAACGGTTEEPAEEPAAEEPMEEAAEEEPMEEEMEEEPMEEEEPAEEEPMEEEPAEEEMEEPAYIKVGLITDVTGGLAIYGEMILRSFFYGMEYATGTPVNDDNIYVMEDGTVIEIFVRDDTSDPATTGTVARELVEAEGVNILVGTVSSGATATLQEIARENQIPLIVAPAAANDITGVNFNEYTFRVSRNNYQDAIALCEYFAPQYETFVQIAPDYSFGYGGATAYRDACTYFGGEFVADDIFAPADTTEFTPYMEQIAATDANAWLVTWAGGGFINMMQAAADLGVTEDKELGAAFINNGLIPVFFGNTVGATSGILYHYTAADNEVNDWLTERMMADLSIPPDLFDADGFNAAMAVVGALTESGGDASADALIAGLEGLEFVGPKGTIFIRPEDHVAVQDMYIMTLENIDSPTFEFFTLVETVRPNPPCLLEGDYADRCGDLPVGSLTGE